MKMLYVCLAMNFSSQATASVADDEADHRGDDGVAPADAAGDVVELGDASAAPSRRSSAGMDRKNDSLVTVTRSKSRSRPADMVAPERDTPGISARHCTTPMIRVSFQVTSSSWRIWVAAWSANHITPLHRISAPATNHRLRSVVSMVSWNSRPTMPIGIEPRMTAQPNR